MTSRTNQTERRTDPLSKERIVAVAVEILDAEGEGALTFRALAARLATGSGALYWHVADKGALLAVATDDVVTRAIRVASADAEPGAAIRAIALGIFDAIDAHPWAGAHLVREPQQDAALQVFEAVGSQLQAFGVRGTMLFDVWSALINYILGAAGLNAANARRFPVGMDRTAYLAGLADDWSNLDPDTYPFMRKLAAYLPDHDDRAQFLAGIDLILAGIKA